MPFPHHPINKGFALLLTVLILGSAGVAITLYLLLSGFDTYQNSSLLEKNNQAKAAANACAEVGISQIQLCSSTIGTQTHTVGDQTCAYTIQKISEQERILTASSTVGTVIRKIKLEISQVTPKVIVSSWQEVNSF